MNLTHAHDILIPAAVAAFPPEFSSLPARAMILAIALQESDLRDRQQLVGHHRNWWESVKGPAVSFWQFERIGIRGVLEHPATAELARKLLDAFGYPASVEVIFEALKHNDLLAAGFARLALWKLPQPLPGLNDVDAAWQQYLQAWAPGKPKPERWGPRYVRAWGAVLAGERKAA